MNHYTYKLRLYPNELQKQKLANHFGSCRYIYNHFLNERKETYLNEKKSLNYYDQAAKLTKLKEKLDWMHVHFPFITWKNIVFCGHKHMIQADYLIDDHEKNLSTFTGTPLLFSAPHNLHIHEYERVNSWNDIKTKLL